MSDSLCNSCAAPMCRWLLKMEICKGMEVAQEDRLTYIGKRQKVYHVYVVTKCPKYQKSEMEEEE